MKESHRVKSMVNFYLLRMNQRLLYRILFTLNIFIIIGCSSSQNIPNSKDFMPLSVGNKWIYGSKSEYILEKNKIEFIKEVLNVDTINSRSYFKIKNEYFGKDSIFTFFYYHRISSDTLLSLYYDSLGNSYFEVIEAIFSLNIGDTTCIDYQKYFGDKCKEFTVVTNRTGNGFEILHNHIDITDEEQWYTYKRGLGVVIIRSAWGGNTELLEYKIQ
jgi:hypothetical protein